MAPNGSEQAKILVTAKTYPTPSQRHVETVCVAGVRLDGPTAPSWIRLYPIPFRTLHYQDQFKKWQLVDADIKWRGSSDPRPESYSPDIRTLRLYDTIDSRKNWSRRRELIGPLIGATTTCELIAANRAARMNESAPSLGLIKPNINRIRLFDGKPWTDKQLAKVKAASMPDLFNTPLNELRPPSHIIKFEYTCQSNGCKGHIAEVLDWEVGVAGFKWRSRYGTQTSVKILEKWESMVASGNDVHFFVGNQHQRRKSFSILGVWYPRKI